MMVRLVVFGFSAGCFIYIIQDTTNISTLQHLLLEFYAYFRRMWSTYQILQRHFC